VRGKEPAAFVDQKALWILRSLFRKEEGGAEISRAMEHGKPRKGRCFPACQSPSVTLSGTGETDGSGKSRKVGMELARGKGESVGGTKKMGYYDHERGSVDGCDRNSSREPSGSQRKLTVVI